MIQINYDKKEPLKLYLSIREHNKVRGKGVGKLERKNYGSGQKKTSKIRSKVALTTPEIKELVGLIRKTLKSVEDIKLQNKHLGQYLKTPGVHELLSESIALRLLNQHKIIPELRGRQFRLGGGKKKPDILETTGKTGVEVKATQENAWQQITKKDVDAAYCIWIHFDDFFRNQSTRRFQVIWCRRNKNLIQAFTEKSRNSKQYKPTLEEFKKTVGDYKIEKFELKDL